MTLHVELEQEDDGRWIADVLDLPGVMSYGATQAEALVKVQALALRVIADRLEHGEVGPELLRVSFKSGMSEWPSSPARQRRAMKTTSDQDLDDDLRAEYDVHALRVVARGPGRERLEGEQLLAAIYEGLADADAGRVIDDETLGRELESDLSAWRPFSDRPEGA